VYRKRLDEANRIDDEVQTMFERELPVALFVTWCKLEQAGNLLLIINRRERLMERVASITVESRITIDCFHTRYPLKD
jgi:hypothetical protein